MPTPKKQLNTLQTLRVIEVVNAICADMGDVSQSAALAALIMEEGKRRGLVIPRKRVEVDPDEEV